MTLRECYAAMGGDYEGVTGRLRGERLVQKFVLKFLNDNSYDTFLAAMERKDFEEAFRAAHTIKGVSQNLGFTRLLESSSKMSDALREGWTPEAEALGEQLEKDYRETAAAIRKFSEGM